jgi:hypothetical protein
MAIQPLKEEGEIRRAFDLVRNQLIDDTRAYVRKVGYQGGSAETPVYWHHQEHFWVCFNSVNYPSELLGQYGVLDPAINKRLHATVEINSPKIGVNRRTAGAFVRGRDGAIFLAHSGRVTITGPKAATNGVFRNFCVGVDRGIVSWPKGKESEMFLIGRIDEDGFPRRVANFVHEIARFKGAIRTPKVEGEATH